MQLRISSADRVYRCPGSVAACYGLPEGGADKPSDAAESGRRVHKAIQVCLEGKPAELPKLTERETWLTNRMVETIRAIEQPLGEPIRAAHELEVSIGKHWKGHLDRVAVWPCTVMLWEWKTGSRQVPLASENVQARFYLAALPASVLPRTVASGMTYRLIVLSAGDDLISPEECDFHDADRWNARRDARKLHQRAMRLDAPRTPGDLQCRFCRARGTSRCPETVEALVRMPDAQVPLDLAQLSMVVTAWRHHVKAIGESAEAMLRDVLESGGKVPGFALGKGKTRRTITNVQAAWDVLSGVIGPEQFLACVDASAAQLKAKYADLRGDLSKKAAMEFCEEVLIANECLDVSTDRPPVVEVGVTQEGGE